MDTSTDTPVQSTSNPPDWFKTYIARGFHLVHYDQRKKGPEGSSAVDWTSPEKRVTSLGGWIDDRNWGVFTGTEISPGKYLHDVDFDWTEGLPLANKLLPDTGFVFGRDSKVYSHAFYTCSEPIPRQFYDDIDKKTVFVELRGTTDDGGIGWQTMLPPSIHPSNEIIQLRRDQTISHDDTIVRRVQLYAVACILFKYIGQRGLLHEQRLALSGFLLSEGLTEQETVDVGEALATATHNDLKDVRFAVRSTLRQLKKGEPVKGAGALSKAMGDVGRDVIRTIRRFLGNQQFLENDKGSIIADSQKNICLALDKMRITLSHDQFSNKIFSTNGTPESRRMVDDIVLIPLRMTIDEVFHFRPSKDFFIDVVKHEAWKRPMHPVREYLSSLTWDGIPRIESWLQTYAGAMDNRYTRAVSSLVLMGAVRRVRTPGCKFDEMLILESAKQGTAKSSALAALCPREDWFSDDLPLGVDAKQVIERTQGKWLIEASELHGYRQREADHIKSFLSRRVDGPVRLAYDRTPTEVPRQFLILGTTNTLTGYLKDFSGARRFWPVRIEQFDLDLIRRDRDQLWAEAAQRESSGESIRLSPELWEDAEMEQEDRRAIHPWEEILTTSPDMDFESDCIPVPKIWTTIGVQANQRSNTHSNIVSEIMQRQGYTRKERRYVDDPETGMAVQQWCWVRGRSEIV